ncbi:MAG: hypothetical protein E7616_02245 [Ruminococcaceae bacterium]|nr:hypothetical protein [Oscillospiraceae bacterium]
MQNSNNKMKISVSGIKRLLICAVSVVLLAALVMGILVAINAYRNSGKGIRNVTVLKSEHFTLTLPMYTYYYRSMGEGADYDLVAMALSEQMALYEAALADNNSLSQERKTVLEAQLQSIEEAAEEMEVSCDEYLAVTYGRGVKISDIRSLLTMTALADQKYEMIWESIAVSENEMADYCKENEEAFLYCDYLFYVFSVPLTKDMNEDEQDQLIAQYEAYANRLAESKDVQTFLDMVVEYEEQFVKEEDENASFTENDIASIRKSVKYERMPYSEYTEGNAIVKEINQWLYSTDRTVGDHMVNPYTKPENNIATFGVYYMTRPLYTNTDLTHTFYDIQLLFSKYTESAAESGIKQAEALYKKNPNETTLQELAKQYGGGLCRNVACTNALDDALYTWLKEERASGDVLVYKSSDGWHMACYKQAGIPECYAQAKAILEKEAYDAQMGTYRKAHAVTVTPNSYYDLPELNYGWLMI